MNKLTFIIENNPDIITVSGLGISNIIACQKSLKNNNIALIPESFIPILKKYNAIAINDRSIFGIHQNESFFSDIVERNIMASLEKQGTQIVLGSNEFDFLIYDDILKKYLIVDRQDTEVLREYQEPELAIMHILKI